MNPYMQMFLSDICLRRSCYNCQFKGLNRESDITLGDFWGSAEFVPDLCDGKGTSIVLTNSRRGELLFNRIKDKTIFERVDYHRVFAAHNDAMLKSASMPSNREAFIKDMELLPFEKLKSKYVHVSTKVKIKAFLERIGLYKQYQKICPRGGQKTYL